MDRKVFCFGDSRTGTTSLHRWFCDQGLRSVHYFVREAGLVEPLHRHRGSNWPRLHGFLKSAPYEAFSDYPVRAFFREIVSEFPGAYFVLTTRRDVETWRRSMARFFGGSTIDFELLQSFYVAWNEEIRALCAESGSRFVEICIDDDSGVNGRRLGDFLGFTHAPAMPHLNRVADADLGAAACAA